MIHLHDAILLIFLLLLFFFKAPPTTEIYTLSLHDALPIYWIVPEQRGVQLDFTGYAGIEFAVDGHRAIGQVGALWKRLYDEASERGHLVPFVPTVPLDFAVGDALYGDAPFASFRGGFAPYVNGLCTISAYEHRAKS